jgi:hypothetical protein
MNDKPGSNNNKPGSNIAASVRQRLLSLSRTEGRDFQEVLTRYALERLLYRLGRTAHHDQFILKGALLFSLWMDERHRATQDMDLLGRGAPEPTRLVSVFQDICVAEVPDDGLVFHAESVVGGFIREDSTYGGVRLKLRANLERARIPLQVDIGFGDAVVPDPEEREFPALLDFPAPRVIAYRRETSIAEKFLALVSLGMDNSRMKDYFDLWLLSDEFPFDGETLGQAVEACFVRRSVSLPSAVPVGLTADFWQNSSKKTQWNAFVRQRVATPDALPAFGIVVSQIAEFLLPVLECLQRGQQFSATWAAGGPWSKL